MTKGTELETPRQPPNWRQLPEHIVKYEIIPFLGRKRYYRILCSDEHHYISNFYIIRSNILLTIKTLRNRENKILKLRKNPIISILLFDLGGSGSYLGSRYDNDIIGYTGKYGEYLYNLYMHFNGIKIKFCRENHVLWLLKKLINDL